MASPQCRQQCCLWRTWELPRGRHRYQGEGLSIYPTIHSDLISAPLSRKCTLTRPFLWCNPVSLVVSSNSKNLAIRALIAHLRPSIYHLIFSLFHDGLILCVDTSCNLYDLAALKHRYFLILKTNFVHTCRPRSDEQKTMGKWPLAACHVNPTMYATLGHRVDNTLHCVVIWFAYCRSPKVPVV